MLMQHGTPDSSFRENLYESLIFRTYIPPKTLETIFLESPIEGGSMFHILSRPVPWTPRLTSFLLEKLREKGSYPRAWILNQLGARSNLPELPEEIVAAMASCLSDSESSIESSIDRSCALEALANQAALPDEILTLMTTCLRDIDSSVRRHAIVAWGKRELWSEQVYLHLSACLNDADSSVRRETVGLFKSRKNWPREGFQTLLAEKLIDEDQSVRDTAARAFRVQTSLPDQIISVIEGYIRTGPPSVQTCAITALGGQPTLSGKLLDAFVELLKTGNDSVQQSIVEILAGPVEISSCIIGALSECLLHDDSRVRAVVVAILGQRPELPVEILQSVLSRFEDEVDLVRKMAAQSLGKRAELPNDVFSGFVKLLEDKAWEVRAAAAEVLCRRPSLPKDVIMKIADDNDVDGYYRQFSHLKALSARKDLPYEAFAGIATAIHGEDASLRRDAMVALRNTPTMAKRFVNDIVQHVNDKDRDVSLTAIHALDQCSHIDNEILRKFVGPSQHPYTDNSLEVAALETVCRQAELPEDILKSLATRFEQFNYFDEEFLWKILQDLEQPYFFRCFLSSRYAAALYKPLLQVSLQNNLSFYIRNNQVCFNMPHGVRRFPVDNSIADSIRGLRPKDLPAVSGMFSKSINSL